MGNDDEVIEKEARLAIKKHQIRDRSLLELRELRKFYVINKNSIVCYN
jgi:hypothetical protein